MVVTSTFATVYDDVVVVLPIAHHEAFDDGEPETHNRWLGTGAVTARNYHRRINVLEQANRFVEQSHALANTALMAELAYHHNGYDMSLATPATSLIKLKHQRARKHQPPHGLFCGQILFVRMRLRVSESQHRPRAHLLKP